jgi:hypothetical protein
VLHGVVPAVAGFVVLGEVGGDGRDVARLVGVGVPIEEGFKPGEVDGVTARPGIGRRGPRQFGDPRPRQLGQVLHHGHGVGDRALVL